MRWKPWLWLCVSIICFIGAAYFWRLGDQWAAQKAAAVSSQSHPQEQPGAPPARPVDHSFMGPLRLLSQPGNLNVPPMPATAHTNRAPESAHRLSNSPEKSLSQLAHSDHAILLANALIDTASAAKLPIPDSLRAQGDPGAYIVQARGPINDAFRAALKNAGASIVAYIPNNAYLVRASQAIAQGLEGSPGTQSVLPYEPYYKFSPGLLNLATEQTPLPEGTTLNLLLFADARDQVLEQLPKLGAKVLGQDSSPFGPVVKVLPPVDALAALAGLSGVQMMEPAARRMLANDLSRAAVGVAVDSVTQSNYLNLSGSNILVNVNDTGVDANHQDLQGRVSFDFPISGVDTNGHGTHVAGIIAGSGQESLTVSNAQGSIMPATDKQFRGKAPAATLFSMEFSAPDSYLQQRAAQTNALISNNSWTYGVRGYDIAAASYDAAVRDSLPTVTGSQPVIYVFPTGNEGDVNIPGSGANEGGSGGPADTIDSPGTAKNVITVGAVEQMRNITNTVIPVGSTNGEMLWFGGTDSSNQVASFSGRGNVGIAVEGDFGRFKPDVVAPGTFVVSTRSGQWDQDAYYNSLSYSYDPLLGIVLSSNATFISGVFVPANGVQLIVEILVSDSAAGLPIYVTAPDGVTTVVATNLVSIPPMGALDQLEDFWQFVISNNTAQTVTLNAQTVLAVTNSEGDYFQVLRNLNDSLGPFYRYESGTSMAAADVSGTLALIAQFFREQLRVTNSPALMKALLINGARSLGNAYNFQVQTSENYQGWGQVQVPNSIPAAMANLAGSPNAPSPLYFFDQNPTNALSSDERQIRYFSVSGDAQDQPLRVTLAWTDPPGNPVASIKLVNDLDLIVVNQDTGDVYIGNNITAGNDFNLAWNTSSSVGLTDVDPLIQSLYEWNTNGWSNPNPPAFDVVNNVENIYLRVPSGTNFAVAVVGHRVNVNAVSTDRYQVAQDYALVISSGNGAISNALTLKPGALQVAFSTLPNVTVMTNSFPTDPENPISGGLLQHQHVGASTPLLGTNNIPLPGDANAVITLGMTNQWHFYVLSNDFNFTNVSFVTFLPPEQAVPRMGVTNYNNPDNATRVQADIDLYVSTNPGLTNLEPNVLLSADKSLSRGGTEFIVFSNAAPRAVYYIGIKAEDQMAAEYSFLGVFSLFPPTSTDTNGNRYLRGMPVPSMVPPGTSPNPQAALVLGLDVLPVTVRRVIVTNNFAHSLPSGLIGNLSHSGKFAILNNHNCIHDAQNNCITNAIDHVYEDNGEGNVPTSRRSDGPGSLKNFIGEEGLGVWLFTMVNDLPAGTGAVNRLTIKLEPQNLDTNGYPVAVLPHTFHYDSIDVPADATNLTVCVSGNTQDMELYIRRDAIPDTITFDYHLTVHSPGDCLSVTIFDDPPLVAGRYYIGVYNPNDVTQVVRIQAFVFRNPYAVASTISSFAGPVPIRDDAITYAYITNLSHMAISSLDVGLLINHPRISDLAITLISPSGTRVLLFEDRGAGGTNGLGTFSAVTNASGTPVYAFTNLMAFYTNNFDDVPTGFYAPGAPFDGWSVLTNYALVYPELPAPWLSNNVLILGDGVVSNTLPTTNSTSYSLSFRVNHAPYLVGTVAWWPLDVDGTDIYGGLNGLLSGDVLFNVTTGMVNRAFFGDGTATRMMVPRCPDLDLGRRPGFTIEGWIRPENIPTNTSYLGTGATVWSNSFEGGPIGTFNAPLYFGQGWFLDTGSLDIIPSGYVGSTAHSGTVYIDSNGDSIGDIYTNLSLTVGTSYQLNFAYARNPDTVAFGLVPQAAIKINGTTVSTVGPATRNSWPNLGWQTTSVVFTASSPITKLQVQGLTPGASGVLLDTFSIKEIVSRSIAVPLMEWFDAGASSSASGQGVQFWLSGLPGTNAPGALFANFWDSNSQPHIVSCITNSLTNSSWQHVALTYNSNSRIARLYRNGQPLSAQVVSPTNFVPRTSADLYLGYHPGRSTETAAFQGGLDEFGVYARALTDCEIGAIFNARSGGKYGTNVLSCPVTNSVQLVTSLGATTYTFINGLFWTNGPEWETNTIYFNNLLQVAFTNGPVTNLTAILLTNLDQNAALDDFVLSGVLTNYVNGLLHFTENTNLALVPIKFAPWPYMVSNFPPTLIFSNDFESVTQGVYQAGSTLPGGTNNPAFGRRDWTVVGGPVTVISNTLVDAVGSNCVALATGSLQCQLPTIPGQRYQLTYSLRGPGAVSWWSGDIEPLSQRAWDLLGGNNGAFIYDATNTPFGLVDELSGANALFFPGNINPSNHLASKIEVGDPVNLRLTNGFTIEGWISPVTSTNLGLEQILFRGDSRDCLDPYYLALQRVFPDQLDIVFHIENGDARDCGVTLATVHHPVQTTNWQHIAVVFEPRVLLTNGPAWPTNQLRIYYNGRWLRPEDHDVSLSDPLAQGPWTDLTGRYPFADLDPAFSPGVSLGNRSRNDYSQPYHGFMDELSVYGRVLTDPEIAAIHARGATGKADFRVPPHLGLAKLGVLLNNVQIDAANGDNSQWTTRTVSFTADMTNLVLTLQSLLPGTLVDGISLTELPAELNYLPEESLASLNGEDAYGTWTLEIWDTRSGGALTNIDPALLQWQLNFVLQPSNPPPVIHLVHGIPYTNILTARGLQNLIVDVPLWATNATNVLLFAADRTLTNARPVGVLWDLTNFPPQSITNALFWPPVSSGATNLTTNTTALPYIIPGQPYYLTITNPNPFAVEFAYGVWFDITSLTNCLPQTNSVREAGIPRYFQFDVPTNAVPPGDPPVEAVLYLTGVQSNYTGWRSNLTVVLSQHLPLPDLTHYDYISSRPSTNDDVVMVLTNTTPFPIQDSRWYVGVFSSASTNIPFTIEACYTTSNYPVIVPLTNGVPFVANMTNRFVAPPGPPRWFFFEFEVTNYVDGILFELYNLSGDADLVLQRDVVPGMAPYFDGSFSVGKSPEQIVLRPSYELPDLRGKWYLGIYNNETTNVAYSIRAVVRSGGFLLSAQPLQSRLAPLPPPRALLLQWNSIKGEYYEIDFSATLVPPNWQILANGLIQATTPLTTFEVPVPTGGMGFYRITQISAYSIPAAPLNIQLWTNNLLRISWSTNFPGETLQSAPSPAGPWGNVNRPVVVEGIEFVVYDALGTLPKYYRLIPP